LLGFFKLLTMFCSRPVWKILDITSPDDQAQASKPNAEQHAVEQANPHVNRTAPPEPVTE
jgi:hypothetical protein